MIKSDCVTVEIGARIPLSLFNFYILIKGKICASIFSTCTIHFLLGKGSSWLCSIRKTSCRLTFTGPSQRRNCNTLVFSGVWPPLPEIRPNIKAAHDQFVSAQRTLEIHNYVLSRQQWKHQPSSCLPCHLIERDML